PNPAGRASHPRLRRWRCKKILLTGFTGVMGKRYAYRLAQSGFEVFCPIRAQSEDEAQNRRASIISFLKKIHPEMDDTVSSRIHAFMGDVKKRNLGMSDQKIDFFKATPIDEIWHLAASLDLTESRSKQIYDTNLLGTVYIIEFAIDMDIPALHYFSTFGASGAVFSGTVKEEVGVKPKFFRNTYERTKFETERFVLKAHEESSLSTTIYRPSIVVGDSITGQYEQFNVFNHPFDVCSRLRTNLMDKKELCPQNDILDYPMRLPANGNATLNIIPLDYAIETVMRLHRLLAPAGKVYHIVNPIPPTIQLGMDVFKRNEPWDGLCWEDYNGKQPSDPYENFAALQLSFLVPYLQGEASYDMTNTLEVLNKGEGLPKISNVSFLDTIASRAKENKTWQEVRPSMTQAKSEDPSHKIDPNGEWPDTQEHLGRFLSECPV
ncbi:MAG: SDR family oxidoreductase, partial [Verrucomicrobiota bacterium]